MSLAGGKTRMLSWRHPLASDSSDDETIKQKWENRLERVEKLGLIGYDSDRSNDSHPADILKASYQKARCYGLLQDSSDDSENESKTTNANKQTKQTKQHKQHKTKSQKQKDHFQVIVMIVRAVIIMMIHHNKDMQQ